MRQILQLGQIRQFDVKRINKNPSVNADHQEYGPAENHEHIVREQLVVDNGKENESNETKHRETAKGAEPRHHFLLVLLSKRNKNISVFLLFLFPKFNKLTFLKATINMMLVTNTAQAPNNENTANITNVFRTVK